MWNIFCPTLLKSEKSISEEGEIEKLSPLPPTQKVRNVALKGERLINCRFKGGRLWEIFALKGEDCEKFSL